MVEGKTIRELFGEDVNGLIFKKLKDKVEFITIREPVKGIKIIKTEYSIKNEEKKWRERNQRQWKQ